MSNGDTPETWTYEPETLGFGNFLFSDYFSFDSPVGKYLLVEYVNDGQTFSCYGKSSDDCIADPHFVSQFSFKITENTSATLQVISLVVNGNGGTAVASDFTAHVQNAGMDVAGSPAPGTAAPGNLYVLSPGTYTVSAETHTLYTQSFAGDCDATGSMVLAAGEDKICTIIHTDIPPLIAVNSDQSSETPIIPQIGILKVPTLFALPRESASVTYNYTVWNLGAREALIDIAVADDKCTPVVFLSGDTNSDGKLDPHESWEYNCTTALSQTTTNTAVATGFSDDIRHEAAIATTIATVVVEPVPGLPDTGMLPPLIDILKVSNRQTPLPFGGGDVTYTYNVKNPGMTSIGNVVVNDNDCAIVSSPLGDTNKDNRLDPDEIWAYTCTTNVTVSTRSVATVKGDANGFTALGYAFSTVLVSASDFPHQGTIILIGIFIFLLVFVSLIVVRRKYKVFFHIIKIILIMSVGLISINPENVSAAKINDASNFGVMGAAGRQVVRTSTGTLYAMVNAAGSGQMWKSTDGTSWTEPDSTHRQTLGGGQGISIAIDSTDTIHVFYANTLSGHRYNTFSTATDLFGTSEVVSGRWGNADIAVDSNNKPHVTGYESLLVIASYSNRISGSWKSAVTVDGSATSVPEGSSITIDNNNKPQIAINYGQSSVRLKAAIGNVNDATSFTLQTLDSSINGTSGSTMSSLAVDTSGNTWIAYVDDTNNITLIKHLSTDAWSTWQTAITDSNAGKEPSIAIDGTTVYVFYQNSTDDLAYDTYTGSWAGEVVLQTGTFQDTKVKWAYYNNNQGSTQIDYLYSDTVDIYWDKLTISVPTPTFTPTLTPTITPTPTFPPSGTLTCTVRTVTCNAGEVEVFEMQNTTNSHAGLPDSLQAGVGPVGWWKMDENTGTTTADSSGNGFTGTLTNGATWAAGKFASAGSFDGGAGPNADVIVIGDQAALELTTFTISGWVYRTGACQFGTCPIVSKGMNGNIGYSFELIDSGGYKIRLSLRDGLQTVTGTTAMTPNTWYHVAASIDGSTIKVYVNGVLENSAAQTQIPNFSTESVKIGNRNTNSDVTYNGRIDDVRIYNYARTLDQIVVEMNSGYLHRVCCSGVTGLGNSCSGTFATVLKLSDTSNAHVRQGTLADYLSATNACLSVPSGGSVYVGYQSTSCSGYDTILGSMIGTTNSHVGIGSWTAGTTKICATASGPGVLTTDIVDSGGTSVALPSVTMGAVNSLLTFQTVNGTFGDTNQKVRVTNTTANPLWSLTIAADGGPTALWSAGTPMYDFNDPTGSGGDGGDSDTYGGQMTLNVTGGTLGGTCSATGITKGSSAAFSEGVTNSITLLSSDGTADTNCYWDLTDVNVSQTLPAAQEADTYSIDMTLTITAN